MHVDKLLKIHPSFTEANDLRMLCLPLEMLGITYFSHVQIAKDGTIRGNASNPLFLEQYLRQGFYNYDFHLAEKLASQEFILWDALERFGQTEEMYAMGVELGIAHVFTLIEKETNLTNYYHFAAAPDNEQINNFYINNIDLLKKFIKHYQGKLHRNDRLSQAYQSEYKLSPDDGSFQVKASDLPTTSDIDVFLNAIDTKAKKEVARNISLTPRELQCALHLLEGKTSKEIAALLYLSSRTIEVYIDRMKARFGSKNKVHLARQLIENNIVQLNFED